MAWFDDQNLFLRNGQFVWRANRMAEFKMFFLFRDNRRSKFSRKGFSADLSRTDAAPSGAEIRAARQRSPTVVW
jgi:hypothetical protein